MIDRDDLAGAELDLADHDQIMATGLRGREKPVGRDGLASGAIYYDAEGKEAASEHAKHTAKPGAATAKYQLKATGAVVK